MIHLGLALGPSEIVAAYGEQLWSRAIEGDDLAAVLGELARQLALRPSRVVVSVALLPPIVQTRRLDLPRLGSRELRRVLTRDAARYFPRCRDPQIANGSPIAACAPAAAIDAIVAAVQSHGWQIDWLGPAHWAWAAAKTGSEPETLVVQYGTDAVESIDLGPAPSRAILRIRRLPAPTTALIASDSAVDRPASIAARYATRAAAAGPVLLPESWHADRVRRATRRAAMTGAIAAALLIVAAVADRVRLDRTSSVIASERRALRRGIAGAVAGRDTLVSLEARASALTRLESTAPRWSAVLVTLAKRLPGDAHLVAVRGRADSLSIDGVADDAAATLTALRDTPGLGAVHADAPIREELADGRRTIEHFAVAARVTP